MHSRPSSPACALTGAVILVLFLSSCGGSPTPAADTASAMAATSTQATTTTASTTLSTSGSSTTVKKKNVIAWILSLGPGAPDGPPEFTAYRELQQRHCTTVFARVGELDEPARMLYQGAAHACLAAIKGDSARWSRAEAALAQVAGRTDELNCMDGAALALLDRLVTLHADHPERTFTLAAGSKSKAPPCPTIGAVKPDRGPVATLVRMTGRHLGAAVKRVSVIDSLGESHPVVGLDRIDGSLEFLMPGDLSSDASASVCIVVWAEPDWVVDGAVFTYEGENTGPPTTLACPPPGQG